MYGIESIGYGITCGVTRLVFLPYLLGERSPRWNPDTSGSFLGIKMEHEKCDYVIVIRRRCDEL